MKRIILMLVLIPSVAGSGDFSIKNTINERIVTCGDVVKRTPQDRMVRRIAKFAMKYGTDEALALEFGVVLARTPYPMTLAAIAARESGFVPTAVGPDGERSAFQILDWPHDEVPLDVQRSADEAVKVLEEKLTASKGNFWKGVEAYNGCGDKARRYANDIKKLRRSI